MGIFLAILKVLTHRKWLNNDATGETSEMYGNPTFKDDFINKGDRHEIIIKTIDINGHL